MRASFFLGNKSFEVRELQPPELGEFDVLVKVMSAGICGTDVHIYHGHVGSAQVEPPVVLGHEYAGLVTETGHGVSTVKVGDHVTIDPNIYCGKCLPCRMGRKQSCENLRALGVNLNGGFAEYSLVPEAQCFPVSRELDFDVAAMAEPLACALHGIERASIQPGQSVLVVGGGTIGLLMVQLARLSGASSVVLSEPIARRREIGLEVGADHAVDPAEGNLEALYAEATGQRGADVVIECVGKAAAVSQAISLAAPGGRVVLFGVPEPEAAAPLPLFDIFKKELKITGSFINPDAHQRAVNLLNSGRLYIKELITHIYGLSQVEDAVLMQMKDESIKVLVHPQEN